MKFLVIEGLDGSGKSTQVKMLKKYLAKIGVDFEYLHFPRTVSPVFGDLIARFLRGDLGNIDQVHPYLVALLFAGDRNDAANQIRQWQESGKLVLVDRYVYSNIAYQCAKLQSTAEKIELMDWILNTEYGYFKIPKPDLNLFLKVPFDFVETQLKSERDQDDREYLQGKEDIHEADINFQQKVFEVYNLAMDNYSDLTAIDCSDDKGQMLDAKIIAEKIKFALTENGILA